MRTIIEIPQSWVKEMKKEEFVKVDALCERIVNGIPLPEQHGRLIDCQAALAEFKRVYFDNPTVLRCAEIILSNAPTIVPSTKEGDE